jgi:hypothetical protein
VGAGGVFESCPVSTQRAGVTWRAVETAANTSTTWRAEYLAGKRIAVLVLILILLFVLVLI